mmetsp:Transcript_15664/g.46216  ORF Transcript_15664/g.46216 Transcript_15664/m.46216 type:complete len:219 (-) Transcript_15664:1919-2575(-)
MASMQLPRTACCSPSRPSLPATCNSRCTTTTSSSPAAVRTAAPSATLRCWAWAGPSRSAAHVDTRLKTSGPPMPAEAPSRSRSIACRSRAAAWMLSSGAARRVHPRPSCPTARRLRLRFECPSTCSAAAALALRITGARRTPWQAATAARHCECGCLHVRAHCAIHRRSRRRTPPQAPSATPRSCAASCSCARAQGACSRPSTAPTASASFVSNTCLW